MGAVTGGEIADLAVRSYQALAWTFLRRTVTPTLFCVAAWLFVVRSMGDVFTSHHTEKGQQVLELAFRVALCFGVALPIFLIGVSWATSIITAIASDWMLDRVPDGAEASKRAILALPRIGGAIIREALLALTGCIVSLLLLFASSIIPDNDSTGIAGVILTVGIVGIVVGLLIAIYVFVIHALVPPIVMIERLKSGAAAKRSRLLVSATNARKQNPGQSALVLLGFVTLFASLGTFSAWRSFEGIADVATKIKAWMPGSVFNVVAGAGWDQVPVFLVIWLVLPIWCLGTVAVYYTTRVRTEGYDIDLLAAEVWQRDKRARFEI